MEDKQELIFKEHDTVFDQYKIIKEIARGGMNSYIYLAEDLKNKNHLTGNCFVAIKVINRTSEMTIDDWNRFYDECVTSIRVSGLPNVIETYRVKKSEDDQNIIVVMEYVNGESLRSVLNKQGQLTLNEALFLFKKLLVALKSLYSFNHKIIHRDLKPENILLSKDRTELKLIDFGIASVINQTKKGISTKLITNESQLFGTYPYLSPDLLKALSTDNEEEKLSVINEQCDFFSIGIILYEMLTGNKPFVASDYTKEEVIQLPLKYDLPDLHRINPKIPLWIENVIFRCIASKPEDIKYRYNNIDEIINEVNQMIASPDLASQQHLLKPYRNRVMQNASFNIDKEKSKSKFYNAPWFFFSMAWLTGLLVLTAIILVIIYHVI
ncbi:serine/threonine protein kinase [Candidatus Malacoplasma girerdii]|uniref:Serine/threonine protein kinase n=1 Tax=Candidatus Malacoplasma girerdii TaxID=1318617 RepID=A0A097SSS0_9BACT|nr:serine/threonine protein kinase [Candidatus Malacoplasma girerdii]ASJ89153.1 MAG: serine/threonine protein kinase [Candidatus Malacoplasma girerdii]